MRNVQYHRSYHHSLMMVLCLLSLERLLSLVVVQIVSEGSGHISFPSKFCEADPGSGSKVVDASPETLLPRKEQNTI